MALDIAPAPPGLAPGIMPGANPAPPGVPVGPFAVLLALQVQTNATATLPPEDLAPEPLQSVKSDKDELTTEATANISPPIPNPNILDPNILPPPVPLGGLTLTPAVSTQLNKTDTKTAEAMDTLPASVPGLPGNTQQGSGLLPRTEQSQTIAANAQAKGAPVASGVAQATLPKPTVRTQTAGAEVGVLAKMAGVTAVASSAQAVSVPAIVTAQVASVPAVVTAQVASVSAYVAVPDNRAQAEKSVLQKLPEPANNTGRMLRSADGQVKGTPALKVAKTNSAVAFILQGSPLQPHVAQLTVEDLMAKNGLTGRKDKGNRETLILPSQNPAPGNLETRVADAPRPAVSLPATDRAALLQQATDAVQTVRVQAGNKGQGQMTLQLHPHDWGKLQVSVTMTPTGGADGGTNVTAHLVAENHAVRAALEDQASDLRKALSDAGMKLEHLTVTVLGVEKSGEAQSANADTRSGQQPGGDAWTPPTSTGSAAGNESFSGFADRQGFYAPPAAKWTGTDEGTDPEPVIRAISQAGAQGIDVRA